MRLALIVALTLGSTAPAQGAEPEPTPPEPAQATPPEPTPAERFEALSARAAAAFDGGRHQEAIDLYLEAYGLLPNADVLYNVAYIYDHHLEKRELAQDFYRRVVRMPDSSKQILELAAKRLAELEAEAKDNDAPAPPADPPREVPADVDPKDPRDGIIKRLTPEPATPWGPIVVTTLGGAALITGVVFGVLAGDTNNSYRATDDLDDKRALESTGREQALTSDVLTIGGGVLVVGGLVWYLATSGEPAANEVEAPSFAPLVGPDSIGVAWRGTL